MEITRAELDERIARAVEARRKLHKATLKLMASSSETSRSAAYTSADDERPQRAGSSD